MAAQSGLNVEELNVPSDDMVNLNEPSATQLSSGSEPGLDTVSTTKSPSIATESISKSIDRKSLAVPMPKIHYESELLTLEEGYEYFEGEFMEGEFGEFEGELEEEGLEEAVRFDEYTTIDEFEINSMGEEVKVQRLVPKIKEEVIIKKKLVPMIVKFNRIGDGDEVIEEEEVVEEEMVFRIIKTTVLIKQLNDRGEEILVEKVIEKEEKLRDKPRKTKKIIVTRTGSRGQLIEEEIEVEEEEEEEKIEKRKTKSIPQVVEAALPEEGEEDFEVEGAWEDEYYLGESIDEYGETVPVQKLRRIWRKKILKPTTIEDDERQFTRQLLEEIKAVRSKKNAVKAKNIYLGKALCHYYKLKGKEGFPEIPPDRQAVLRKQYHKRLLEFNELRKFIIKEQAKRSKILEEAREVTKVLKEELEGRVKAFFEKQREVVKKLDPKICKMVLPHVNFEQLIDEQYKMDRLLSKVRLDYVKKMHKFTELKSKHAQRKKFRPSNREDDMDIVTYEKMRIQTRELNDKLDIKETQIMGLKEKLVHAVQTLAHVRFKNEAVDAALQDINKEILDGQRELKEVKNECAVIREKRVKIGKLVQKMNDKEGILKYPRILHDYYHVSDEKWKLMDELAKAKEIYANQLKIRMRLEKKHQAAKYADDFLVNL